jgi:hypothetical protein
MDRIGALERLSKLRSDGVLTDAQFEETKRTWIDSIAPAPNAGVEDAGTGSRLIALVIVGAFILIAIAAAAVLWRAMLR